MASEDIALLLHPTAAPPRPMPDVVVNATRGRIVLRAVPASSTIAALKDRLAAHRDCGRPATWIQLRHRGTLLDDTVTLAAQGISQWTLISYPPFSLLFACTTHR